MENNMEEKNINVVYTLCTVMQILVSYVDTKSLDNVAEAFTLWRDEVLREREKRASKYYMSLLRLPTREGGKLVSNLDLHAKATVLFYKEGHEAAVEHYQDRIIENSMNPSHKIRALRIDEFFTVNEAEFSIAEYCPRLELKDSSDIVGLTFSHLNSVNVHAAYLTIVAIEDEPFDTMRDRVYHNFIEQLGLNSCETGKSTIVLFIELLGARILEPLFNSFESKHEIMVFYVIDLKPARTILNRLCYQHCAVGLRFSSPKVESWTTLLHCGSPFKVIELKLLELKERVKLRRRSIGLLGGRFCDELECNHLRHPAIDRSNIMEMLKRFFPRVPFLGLLRANRGRNVHRELSSPEPNYNSRLQRDTSIMVITYD